MPDGRSRVDVCSSDQGWACPNATRDVENSACIQSDQSSRPPTVYYLIYYLEIEEQKV